jgi:hypothetical protein
MRVFDSRGQHSDLEICSSIRSDSRIGTVVLTVIALTSSPFQREGEASLRGARSWRPLHYVATLLDLFQTIHGTRAQAALVRMPVPFVIL